MNVLAYYIAQAVHDYMATLEECAAVLMTTVKLKRIGFITDFSKGLPRNLNRHSTEVEFQDQLAFQCFDLFVNTAFNRASSMMFHSHSYPGQCPLLASQPVGEHPFIDNSEFEYGVRNMRRDYRIWLDLQINLQSRPAFIQEVVNTSPYNTRFIREMAACLTMPI